MKDSRNRILELTAVLFAETGIIGISLDEIVGQLGMQNKRFQKYFPSKHILVTSVVEHCINIAGQRFRVWRVISPNAVSELMHCFNQMEAGIRILSDIFIRDLGQLYPVLLKAIIKAFRDQFGNYLEQNIARGIDEHLYHDHFDPGLTTHWYLCQLETILFEVPGRYGGHRKEMLAFVNNYFLRMLTNDAGKRMGALRGSADDNAAALEGV